MDDPKALVGSRLMVVSPPGPARLCWGGPRPRGPNYVAAADDGADAVTLYASSVGPPLMLVLVPSLLAPVEQVPPLLVPKGKR